MDPALKRLASAAEAEQRPPRVALFVPSAIISGQPVGRKEYLRLFESQLGDANRQNVTARRRERDAAMRAADQQTAGELALISEATTEGM